MFGPNPVPSFSHRGKQFKTLIAECDRLFRQLLPSTVKSDVVFVTGSGTLANEIVISSCRYPLRVATKGQFSERLAATAAHHAARHQAMKDCPRYMGVQYETAESKRSGCDDLYFVDCVSSFPYYPPPFRSTIWTTVASKQLGAQTGLSIIVIRDPDPSMTDFYEGEPSYLSLMRYVRARRQDQTPNTPAISALQSLRDALDKFNLDEFRRRIDARYWRLVQACAERRVHIVGVAPVLTILCDPGSRLGNLLFQMGAYVCPGGFQIFTWSGTDAQHEQLVRGILDA